MLFRSRKFIQIKNAIKNYVNSFQKSIDDIVEDHEKEIKNITDLNIKEKDKDKTDKS